MRFPASILVLILVALTVTVGLFTGRSADPTSSVAAESEILVARATPAADATGVTTGGGGSTPIEVAQPREQEWVRVPGTGVAIWPKPESK